MTSLEREAQGVSGGKQLLPPAGAAGIDAASSSWSELSNDKGTAARKRVMLVPKLRKTAAATVVLREYNRG